MKNALKIIEGYLKSNYFKIIFFIYIFLAYNLILLKLSPRMVTLRNLDLQSYGQLLSLLSTQYSLIVKYKNDNDGNNICFVAGAQLTVALRLLLHVSLKSEVHNIHTFTGFFFTSLAQFSIQKEPPFKIK